MTMIHFLISEQEALNKRNLKTAKFSQVNENSANMASAETSCSNALKVQASAMRIIMFLGRFSGLNRLAKLTGTKTVR